MDYAGIVLRIIGCKKNRELFQNNRFLLLCAHACNPRYACVVYTLHLESDASRRYGQ